MGLLFPKVLPVQVTGTLPLLAQYTYFLLPVVSTTMELKFLARARKGVFMLGISA
jgi:hypothetical protein